MRNSERCSVVVAGVLRKAACCRRGWAFPTQRGNKRVVTSRPPVRLTCSEIPCLLGILLSHFSDSQLVCWQEGAAQDPQCSETGIQDKKYLGACGIEPFLFACSVCLLLKKSEFFLQFWIGEEDRLRIFKLFPIPPNNSFEDVWK